MLLGQRLVELKLATVEQVQTALQSQVVHGGRIGTWLLKKSIIDIDTLGTALATHVGVAQAKLKHFENVDKETLARLPASLAAKRKALPLATVNRNGLELLVALRDPKDVAAIDEISFVAAARVRPFIAPELCIARYIERYYGIRLELEFPPMPQHPPRARGPSAVGPPPAAITMPNAPLPSASAVTADLVDTQPRVQRSRLLPHPSSWIPPAENAPPAQPNNADSILGGIPMAPAVDFVQFPGAEASPWASEVPKPRGKSGPLPENVKVDAAKLPAMLPDGPWSAPPAPVMWAPPAAVTVPNARPPARPALSLDDAIAKIGKAASREEIGDTIVDYLRSTYACGLVFIVKEEVAFGWRGFAPSLEKLVIETLTVPLNTPSILQVAYARASVFRGAPSESASTIQSHFYKLLKSEPPLEAIVAPVAMKNRTVNLIYAHGHDGQPLPEVASTELARLSRAAADGFLRIIKTAKERSSSKSGSQPPPSG